jgi:hypothetical protein
MNHQRNYILQAAVAAALGLTAVGAHAGFGSALPATIATAAVAKNTTVVVPNAVSYSTTNPLSPNTVYYLYVKLTAVGASATPTFADTPLAVNVFTAVSSNNASMVSMLTGATATLSADSTFVVYALGVSTSGAIPVNTTIVFIPKGAAQSGEVDGLAAVATAPGSTLNASVSIGSALNTTSVMSDIDSASGGNTITFAAPQSYFVQASSGSAFLATGSFAGFGEETAVIDVLNTGGIDLLNVLNGAGNTLDFGGFRWKDVGGILGPDQSTSWTMANEYTGGSMAATLTGNFTATSEVGIDTAPACATTVDSFTINTAKSLATIAAGTPQATGVPQFVCMTFDGTDVIQNMQPTLITSLTPVAGSYYPAGATELYPATGASALYNLGSNGGSVTVRSYLPVAVGNGYQSVVRIINIGGNPSTISVQVIDQVTGVPGAVAVLASTPLASGGATNFSSTQIEAALATVGVTLTADQRPRLLFTGSTTFEAQSYTLNPDGTIATFHGKE